MLYAVIKALLSGVVIAAASEAAKRSPAIGAVILSLPLISILAFFGCGGTPPIRERLPHCRNRPSGSCCRRCRCSLSCRRCCAMGLASGLHSACPAL